MAALLNPRISRNTTLIVHSFTATPNEILEEYERQTNSKWDVSYTSLERLKEIEREEYQVYSPLASVVTLRRIWTEGGTLYKYYDESLLGHVETETLEDQVARNVQKQLLGENMLPLNMLRKLSIP